MFWYLRQSSAYFYIAHFPWLFQLGLRVQNHVLVFNKLCLAQYAIEYKSRRAHSVIIKVHLAESTLKIFLDILHYLCKKTMYVSSDRYTTS